MASDSKRKLPTLRDVAERAGVSTMTASRVLNGNPRVSARAREAVEQAIAAINYVPNPTARMLAGSTTRRVCLLHSDSMTSAYLGELLLGALHEAPSRHIHLTVEQHTPGITAEALVSQVLDAHVAGVILPPPLCDWRELVEQLKIAKVMVVRIAPDGDVEGAATVSIDDRRAAYDMTRHLIELGHSRIGFIQGNKRHRGSLRRLEGHVQALRDHAIEPEPLYTASGDFSYRSGLTAAAQLLDLPTPPTAIFACNDDMAAAAITVAHQRRIAVPAELTICGFDDTPLASSIWPALTTIRQPIREMSRAAMELFCSQLWEDDGEDMDQAINMKLEYQLIRRQSDAVILYR